ncbi:transcriptional regulator SlyA [Vibrio sp. 10N.222.51.C8]|uniref:transcriptional regulator SlyA n=2 Tax=Pseudomonadota TaxID=1224 RepID=UPI00030F0B78|nr:MULTISPECIES: transcriptional regulator SlyA [Gammaproteobacteria]ANP77938.1 MarR family transcriptional regulator [Vibrio crassostreae 9CS106]MDO6621146.1 transcriptional regulator SlyA [Shewanella sp. 6_MG-2023]MDO6638522.1 transcriptional regulator SlyA [Shewanella sp. 5_MG-2023]MDO6680498.1 transcriptional regulator SlyA [Shewanella sp. 4_MG-2023]MDO6777528.1 transcriptional regulator SlyA [Shewanella sp. 3_MG-2023]
MQKEFDHMKELSLAEQLGRLHRLWRTAVDIELAPLELTYPRWTALWKLWRLGDNLSQKVLANALEIELASLMRTLAQLEQQGLIERHCCPHDKRARLVNLTPAGLDLITKVEVTIINIRSQLLLGINAEELTEFERVINLIGNNALTKLAKMTDK